ncbi:MAG: peptidase MA family metallohydrolase, partial [Dehalococcoidia bacterium]
YSGDDPFARELMHACEEGLAWLTQDIGTYPERPIKVYSYATSNDLKGAMVFSQEWTGGVAFIDFSIIAISVPPSELEWGKRAVVHELTHLVVRQTTFSPYGRLPVWLDEGLATNNEGELDPAQRSYLEQAALDGELISVRSLCSPFSAYSEKARLSYAESYSLVEYLLDNYEREKMLDLLTLLKQGNTYDEALVEVYGCDINGLDARWRAMLTDTVTPAQGISLHPVAIGGLAALVAALAVWGVLTLKRRTGRRSSGKSIMQVKP